MKRNRSRITHTHAHTKWVEIEFTHYTCMHVDLQYRERWVQREQHTVKLRVGHLLVCELLMQGAFSTDQPPEKPRNEWACGTLSHSVTCLVAQWRKWEAVRGSDRDWESDKEMTAVWDLVDASDCWDHFEWVLVLFCNSCLHQMHQMFSIMIRIHCFARCSVIWCFQTSLLSVRETLQCLCKSAALLGAPNRVHSHKLIREAPEHQN